MKNIKAKLKEWTQGKMKTLNGLVIKQLAYISRAEHLNNCALNSNERGTSDEQYGEHEIIVSLTTYDRRLCDVYLAIESIMQQTLKPNRIILWISDELKNSDIPLLLQKQQKRGLEIRYCKDIRSYTKLIPALRAFPSSVIITVDDDHLYNVDLIEHLVNAHKKNPGLIYGTKIHRMKLRSAKSLEKYTKWIWNYQSFDISPLNFPTGVGGVLYPPHCFNDEVFNEKVFLDICKYADDVWFKAMALLNNTASQKVHSRSKDSSSQLRNEAIQDTSLQRINVKEGMNDVALKAVFGKYNLYERLTTARNSWT
jgi:hypothetical protein